MEELHDFLAAEIDEGLFASGGQIYVSVAGEPVVDWAFGVDGVGCPVTTDTLFSVYCAAKPALVAAIGTLLEGGELSLDDQLGHVVHRSLTPHLGHTLVGELLSHTAGLHGLTSPGFTLGSDDMRAEWLQALAPPPGWRVGVDVGYAHAAWDLLGWAVRDLTGLRAREFVRKAVLGPLGVGADLFVAGMTDLDYDRQRDRLGVNLLVAGFESSPILAERTRRLRCVESPANGNTASARGLGRLYEGLLDCYHGRRGDVVASATLRMLAEPASYGCDATMQRDCGYGFGFMVGLADHLYGRACSPAAFGHSGFAGVSAAFCDPDPELVVAFHFNGIVDNDSALTYRRPALVERIYRTVLGWGGARERS